MTKQKIKLQCLKYDKMYGTDTGEYEGKNLYYYIVTGKEEYSEQSWDDWEKDMDKINL